MCTKMMHEAPHHQSVEPTSFPPFNPGGVQVPTQPFTSIIAVSVFFMAAWELMILNDRLTSSPPGLSLRGWLLVAFALHITCIALSSACLGWRLKFVDLGVEGELVRRRRISGATNLVIIAFATSVVLSGLL